MKSSRNQLISAHSHGMSARRFCYSQIIPAKNGDEIKQNAGWNQFATGNLSPALNFFRSLPISVSCQLNGPRLICGNQLWVTGMRLPSGDYLIIVSNDHSDKVMSHYSKRWKIEVLFQSLKSRGFNFEDVNLKDEECLKRLFAVVTIAFCWAYHVGAWLNEVKPIRIKKHQPDLSVLCVQPGFMRLSA